MSEGTSSPTEHTDPLEMDQSSSSSAFPFFVVGIGASAGGLESLEKLFAKVPLQSGMAFVIIQHLSPDFKSVMDELLARRTSIPIHRAEDKMLVKPDNIYLLPPKKEMIISQGRLLLSDKDPKQAFTLPIDHFFRSLGQDIGARSIGIILSGSGSDGSRGLQEIANAGGYVIAESEKTAKFESMPRSACQTGRVDDVLTPSDMAKALLKHVGVSSGHEEQEPEPKALKGIEAIFGLLKRDHSIDFSHYKPTTVMRRIERRLSLQHNGSLEDYVELLRNTPEELTSLYKDLLIGVTRFFRDTEAFERVEREVMPALLEAKADGEEIRVWVAGCATGEEAYSLSILLDEALTKSDKSLTFKLFATDVHRVSLDHAGRGIYEKEQLEGISPERLKRYFHRENDKYQISKDLRQRIVFAQHNVLTDAPFTNLDLVTCRNLLIYFQPQAQKKALTLFHFGLNTGGILFLGSSETPGDLSEEFQTLDLLCKLYRKRRDIRFPTDIHLPLSSRNSPAGFSGIPRGPATSGGYIDLSLMGTYDQLLDRWMPMGFLVSEYRELLDSFAGAERLLRPQARRPSNDLVELLPQELKTPVAVAIQRASRQDEPVRFAEVNIELDGETKTYRISAESLTNPRTNVSHVLILFEELERSAFPNLLPQMAELDVGNVSETPLRELEDELRYTRENLQATLEEMETSNEELQATNEELFASNEELQSTNEELHSVNEELNTVNAEHQKKIEELNTLNEDVNNLLKGTKIGTIFLDQELRIRKFTPAIQELFDLLPQDIGRSIQSFAHRLHYPELMKDLQQTWKDSVVIEREVTDDEGQCWFLRILPYEVKKLKKGLVLTFTNISALADERKKADRLSAIVQSTEDAIVGKDLQGRVTSWNPGAERLYGYTEEEMLGKSIQAIIPAEYREEHEKVYRQMRNGEPVVRLDTVRRRKDGKLIDVALSLSPIFNRHHEVVGVSVISRDISEKRRHERKEALSVALNNCLRKQDSIHNTYLSIVDSCCRILEVELAELWLPGNELDCLALRASVSTMKEEQRKKFARVSRKSLFPQGVGILGKAWESRHVIITSVESQQNESIRYAEARNLGLTTIAAIPILEGESCAGVLCLFTNNSRSVARSMIQMLQMIGHEVGQVIHRKRAQAALAESEARFRGTFENMAVGIAHVSLEGQWLQVNQRLCAITGYSEEELLVKTFQEITHPDDLAKDLDFVDKLIQAELNSYQIEKRYFKKDGSLVWILLTVSLARDELGRPQYFISVIEDISVRKEMEEKLQESIERREMFLAMLSHELRNPLNAIRTASHVLNTTAENELAECRSRKVIDRQTTHMSHLLDDLLDVSRITCNKVEFRKQQVDLISIIEDAIQAVRPFAESSHIELQVELPESGGVCVLGDATRLHQLHVNMLTNAIKYSNSRTTITLKLDTIDSQAIIHVRDQGIGVREEYLEDIFELFFQTERGLARSEGGMGIGLALARMIVEGHGGTIKAHSDGPEKGCEVIVSLPLKAIESQCIKKPANVTMPVSKPSNIVIVEDEQDNRTLLQMLLEMDGFQVQAVEDGKQGIDLILQQKPGVAIVDIGLPIMNGYEVARSVRDQLGNRVFLIALTGYSQPQDVQDALEAGFDVHLSKPLDINKLTTILHQRQMPS